MTNSGGPSILAADKAEAVGLDVAEPGPDTRGKLSEFLPAHAALKNPIDLTVEATERGYRETLKALLAGNDLPGSRPFDAAVAINIAPPYLDSVPIARGIIDAATATGKPVVTSFLPEAVTSKAIGVLREGGILNFPTPERAVVALAHLAHLSEARPTVVGLHRTPPSQESSRPALPPSPILEPDAMLWLASNGIPTPIFMFAENEEEAAGACYGVGFPAVMKVVSPNILHKSERGGVVVGIRDEVAAREAFRTIRRRAEGATFAGVVVYPLIRDSREVLIGLSA